MHSQHGKLLMKTLGALALGATAFCLASPVEAGVGVAHFNAASPALRLVADRCQAGFHEVKAPNGNGYRCEQDDDN
jgi:hypothetical protein